MDLILVSTTSMKRVDPSQVKGGGQLFKLTSNSLISHLGLVGDVSRFEEQLK